VAARLNTDRRQINETEFDPESRVERSVRIVKETGSSQNQANRTPVGVEQNLPEEEVAVRTGDLSTRSNDRREELTNYELNTKTVSTVSDGYRVEALTVAVVINRGRLLSVLGADADAAALEAHLKEIEKLVGTAVGLDAERGDRITVAAVDFFNNGQPLEPVGMSIGELLLSQTGPIVKAVALLAATMLLIWFGLKPALNAVLDPAGGGARSVAGGRLEAQPMEALQAAEPTLPGAAPNLIADLKTKLGRTPQKRLEQMVDFDEEQAAAVLKQWMREARRA